MEPSLARSAKGGREGKSGFVSQNREGKRRWKAQTARSWGGLDRTSLLSFSSRSMMVL